MLEYCKNSDSINKVRTKRLSDFDVDERKYQDILFHSLDRLFPDDELIMLKQSQRWREEPDLMAIDKNGYLYIFELKAWESNPENILQVLRYGQIFGDQDYDALNEKFVKSQGSSVALYDVFKNKFSYYLEKEKFNLKQVFIVMTNGLDIKTREAIKYWRTCGLDIRPWIYRIYGENQDKFYIEISPFRVEDNPYEDIAEGYYILNTNYNNEPEDHNDMLQNHKAAAYYSPWKYKIERLVKGDIVFLYQSGIGVVGFGEASGKLIKKNYHDIEDAINEEYSMQLNNFVLVNPPLTASEIKKITEIDYRFMSTMFGIDNESGKKIKQELESRKSK